MKAQRFNLKACCGGTSIIFKTDTPITESTLKSLISFGFNEVNHFTKCGILYADNSDFIVTGPFGSDRLQVKCKKPDCNQKISDFEALIPQLE